MVHDPHSECEREGKRSGEPEGMKERKDAHKPVLPIQREGLPELFDVRTDVVVGEHHPFRIAGASAGENDRRQVVEHDIPPATQGPFQRADGERPGH